MKKTFPCGHKGKGSYCHKCVQEAKQAADVQQQLVAKKVRAEERRQAFAADLVDLEGLPQVVIDKARRVIADLGDGANWLKMGGRKFIARREIVRFPLPCHYRLVCEITPEGIVPLAVMTHEAYNKWL